MGLSRNVKSNARYRAIVLTQICNYNVFFGIQTVICGLFDVMFSLVSSSTRAKSKNIQQAGFPDGHPL
jgi:hypothetical protein